MGDNLRAVARAAGLDVEYVNWRGEPAAASDESVRLALAALGSELGVDVAASGALAELEARRWSEVIGPVVVAWDGALEVPIRVEADRDAPWHLDVAIEDGRTYAARGSLFELPAGSHTHSRDRAHCIRRVRLSLDGALGYGALAWRVGDRSGEALVIAAPTRAWRPPGPPRKRWGVFAPVYGLASRASGGVGDLATLRTVMQGVERRGGAYVATLPLLAAPFAESSGEFSPYSPVSRMFWNELYLDLPRLGAQLGIPVPLPPVAAPRRADGRARRASGPMSPTAISAENVLEIERAMQRDLGQGETRRDIDYAAQYAWRRPIIDELASAWLADAARRATVDTWATESGAWDYAAFRALGEQQRASWPAWPAQLRDGLAAMRTRNAALASGAESARVDAHVFAQWAMTSQLESLRTETTALYLDLPVGVSVAAYEIWRQPQLFVTGLAAGAPPDALFLGGQNWGLPPISPAALRRDKYRYWIECVRRHMRVAGLLRVDHVMGLFRLYCVPDGRPATDGVYVRYPAEELLAVLTLESARAQCAIVGEDLGTVPDNVRPAMAKHGLYRLHVGQWHFPTVPGATSEPAPADSVAALNTHDTATFAGWWTGADITDKRELGLIDVAQERRERDERETSKAAVAAMVPPAPHNASPQSAIADPMQSAMIAVTVELARGPAEVVLVSLDDVALERVPHNVPGTASERPNWHRRIADWEAALDSDVIAQVAAVRSDKPL